MPQPVPTEFDEDLWRVRFSMVLGIMEPDNRIQDPLTWASLDEQWKTHTISGVQFNALRSLAYETALIVLVKTREDAEYREAVKKLVGNMHPFDVEEAKRAMDRVSKRVQLAKDRGDI